MREAILHVDQSKWPKLQNEKTRKQALATIAALQQFRLSQAREERLTRAASSGAATLTTNQGTPISDNQNSLRAGSRGPDAARRLHLPREDHPLRSRAHSRAHRPRARLRRARLLPALQVDGEADAGGVPAGSEGEDAGVRALLDGGRRRRLRRHAARRARLRREVLHGGRQLRPGRQQHPGLLHPGRDQVSRPRPRREDGARSRLSAGRVARTTRSGTSSR